MEARKHGFYTIKAHPVVDAALGQVLSLRPHAMTRSKKTAGNLCIASIMRLASSPDVRSWYNSMSSQVASRLLYVIKSGLLQPTSQIGCYASHAMDYSLLAPLFDGLNQLWFTGVVSMPITEPALPLSPTPLLHNGYDLRQLGLTEAVSIRMRVSRNIDGYPLPSSMGKVQRLQMEQLMLRVLSRLVVAPGSDNSSSSLTLFSLTPHSAWASVTNEQHNPWLVSEERYLELIDLHIIFQNMSNDPYLTSAGVSSEWPAGRGCAVLAGGRLIVWYGEEDHLRMMALESSGHRLEESYRLLSENLAAFEAVLNSEGMQFAKHAKVGFVSSCPTNLGVGLRASVLLRLPGNTTTSVLKWRQNAASLGLSLRGFSGEGSAIHSHLPVEVTSSHRPFKTSLQMLSELYQGVGKLWARTQRLALK